MEENKLTVRAVDRALDILLCFIKRTEWTLTDIAVEIGLHKSTVHRMLATLEERGFVVKDTLTDLYKLGIKIWELATHISNPDDPAGILLQEMERLRDEVGETVTLYIRDGDERIRIQAVQSSQAVRRVAHVGARLPLYVGASGKVLLAYADREAGQGPQRESVWDKQVQQAFLRSQLEQIRQAGYATSMEEREQGAAAISAPIMNRSGYLAAALSVSGPSSRLTMEEMHRLAPRVMESARRMGIMLL